MCWTLAFSRFSFGTSRLKNTKFEQIVVLKYLIHASVKFSLKEEYLRTAMLFEIEILKSRIFFEIEIFRFWGGFVYVVVENLKKI